jgi:hypothetical protein
MSSFAKQVRPASWLMLGLLLLVNACVPAVTPAPSTPQVLVITQVLTQVVTPTPVPPMPTAPPSSTPEPTPTFDPYSAPIYYPLKDCVGSRLHVGDVAMVTPGGTANAIRYSVDLQADAIAGYAQPGTYLTIVEGPWCSHGWIVWQVQMADGLVGFTPEGNGNEYWLVPIPRP